MAWHSFKKTPQSTHIVHGEPDSAEALRQAIVKELDWTVDVASYMEKVEVPVKIQSKTEERGRAQQEPP